MWNLDRFSRDKYDTAVYKTRLKKNGVSLYYSDQSIPDTPEGIILESLLEGFAQYYSANLARNAKRGLQENARKCLWNGGCVPLGYLIDEHQRFVLEPIGAACVRMIFELYASGQSIKSIVCTLNEKGYKTVKGNRFRLGSIQGILRNRKYIGEYHASGITVPNGIPAIVDVQLFNDVQARLGVVASAKAHNKADIPYLLTTKVFCGHCGSPMIGESGTGKGGATYRYYKCSCRKNRKGTCDKKTEPKDWLEENVVRQTVKNVLRPEVIKEISENCAAALKADASDESLVQALKAQLAETDKALRNLLKAIEAGIISSTTRERMAELESQKSELEAQIAREQLRKPEITAEQISFWLESFLAGDIHDPKYQERIINALVRRVDVYDDGPEKQKLTVFYNITKNNHSSSKVNISKCSDIECIALACCRFQLSVNALLFPALLLFLLLYLKSVVLPPSKALFVFFTATMLVSFSATLSCYLCAPLELHNDQPVFTLPSGLIGLALTFAVLLVFSLLFRRKIHWMLCNVSFSAIWRALFVAPLFLTGLFIWMTPIYPAVVLTGRVREISIVLLISFLSLLFWFYYFVYLTTRKMSEAAELHAQNQLLSMENTRYRELREHMDATRQLRHDFRQHLHVIAGLSEAKKYDKLNDYLAEYEGRLASPHTMLCANAALDAIAGHYQRIAEIQNTRISWRLDLPERLPLDEVDLCMMLGNLLENALRAVCALPVEAREVRVVSGMIGGAMLGLSVENGYVGEIDFAPNGLPTSHKKDHGVGLASVAATVKRHNGTLSIAAKDGVFSAHILLSL